MRNTDRALFVAYLLLLPLAVAFYDLSLWSTLALLMLGLLARWFLTLKGLVSKPNGPNLILETVGASHFAEKARWCLDLLEVDYEEQPWCGTLGAYYLGRTVPRLWMRTGSVWSSIGNSPEILRFLWGSQTDGNGFLEPTAERLALEKKIDRCGVMLQIWVYYHILDYPKQTMSAWGVNDPRVPLWQRTLMRLVFPVQRFLIRTTFKINQHNYERACVSIDELLAHIDTQLADGRKSILGDAEPNFTDISFAAINGLWLQPEGFGGSGSHTVFVPEAERPEKMRADVERWKVDHPRATAYIEELYRTKRSKDPETDE